MRLWSLHPSLLDRAALVAGWREGLLAQKVLQGNTKGYRNHPQLDRFRAGDERTGGERAERENTDGVSAALIAGWLWPLAQEASKRGYRFNQALIVATPAAPGSLTVTQGQLAFELEHLRAKVAKRSPEWLHHLKTPKEHPLFSLTPGPVEPWERAAETSGPEHTNGTSS